ncbi:MAG: hypothetical protein ACTSU2_16900 [Promethearchaeota archaeon]
MPVVTIKIDAEMFKTLKEKYPFHGDISRVIRNAIRAINKGVEFTAEGDLDNINGIISIALPTKLHLSLMQNIKEKEVLKKIAIKNADLINEQLYSKNIVSFNAIKEILSILELSNILKYKWVHEEGQINSCLVYINEIIYNREIIENYFNEFIQYICKLNRLNLEISEEGNKPVYHIFKTSNSLLI